jgi:hypothetical protein
MFIMFTWILANLATILISLALLAVFSLVIFNIVRKRKRGESSCGSCCSGCALADKCHPGAFENIAQR